jgi:penicillin-binding protein 1A
VGNDDKRISLGKKETGARAALPIWIEFMQQATQGMTVENFPNVTPLEKIAPTKQVLVDVPDTAPPADAAEQGLAPAKVAPVIAAPAAAKPAPKLPPSPKTLTPTSARAPARVTAVAAPHL